MAGHFHHPPGRRVWRGRRQGGRRLKGCGGPLRLHECDGGQHDQRDLCRGSDHVARSQAEGVGDLWSRHDIGRALAKSGDERRSRAPRSSSGVRQHQGAVGPARLDDHQRPAGRGGHLLAAGRPQASRFYMLRYSPPQGSDLAAAASWVLRVGVRPVVGKPSRPSTVKAGKTFTVSGTLAPHIAKGSASVRIRSTGRGQDLEALHAADGRHRRQGRRQQVFGAPQDQAQRTYRFRADSPQPVVGEGRLPVQREDACALTLGSCTPPGGAPHAGRGISAWARAAYTWVSCGAWGAGRRPAPAHMNEGLPGMYLRHTPPDRPAMPLTMLNIPPGRLLGPSVAARRLAVHGRPADGGSA